MPGLLTASWLAAVAVAVGVFIGAVGVGGVLLIPFLLVAGYDIHVASATALFTFLFTGVLGTWLFMRHGSVRWKLAVPVCLGAVFFGYFGSLAAAHMDRRALTITIASIIIATGAYAFVPPRRKGPERDGSGRGDLAALLGVGTAAGFGAGLSGAGGPLFAVPFMVILGFAPLAAVGASQVLQIVAAVSGSLASFQDGRIDYLLGLWLTVFELAGVFVGVRLAHAVDARILRRMAATLCIVVGALVLARAL